MLIKKGDLVEIEHQNKGKFQAIATDDFDSVKEEFYPLKLANGQHVRGLRNTDWVGGEKIPCCAAYVYNLKILKGVAE